MTGVRSCHQCRLEKAVKWLKTENSVPVLATGIELVSWWILRNSGQNHSNLGSVDISHMVSQVCHCKKENKIQYQKPVVLNKEKYWGCLGLVPVVPGI
jgi:hypothetical protein